MRSFKRTLLLASGMSLVIIAGCSTPDPGDAELSGNSAVETPDPPLTEPLKRTTHYVGIITKGSTWTGDDTETSRQVQSAHLDNIRRLADLGILSLAGPFYRPNEEMNNRGLFFYNVPSMDSALALVQTDPAVVSGQLSVDVLRWRAPESLNYNKPIQMRPYIVAFIHPGDNWTAGQDWSYASLMAAQQAKAQQSTSVRAMPVHGPFVSSAASGHPLALVIYDADSTQYVTPLLDAVSDISSGVLSYETMYWYGPSGLTF